MLTTFPIKILNEQKKYSFIYAYVPDHPYAVNNWLPVQRVVVENSIRKFLKRSEHVVHIDGDTTNNCLSNLKIIDDNISIRKVYTRKGTGAGQTYLVLKCPHCGKTFERVRRLVNKVAFCCITCAASFRREIQNFGQKPEHVKRVDANIIREYTRKESEDV